MIDDQIRRYVRVSIDEKQKVSVVITRFLTGRQGIDIQPIHVRPINLSSRGVKMASKLQFKRETLMEVEIKIEDKKVKTKAKILRVEKEEEYFTYGVTFVSLNEFDKTIINNYVKRRTITEIQNLRRAQS